MTPQPTENCPPRIRGDGLRGKGGRPYRAHPDLIVAANAALFLNRPLLLTGEPGCGKTDFAYAVAGILDPASSLAKSNLEHAQVRSDSRARDLFYSYDALARFSDAHDSGDADQRKRARVIDNYIEAEGLGRAMISRTLRVALIDEIDKAPRDLPNDILRELELGYFEISEIPADRVPNTDHKYQRRMPSVNPVDDGFVRPFIIITSNSERQLPDPFLRRCVFFHLPFPGTEALKEILRGHFPPESLQSPEATPPRTAPQTTEARESEVVNSAVTAFERLRAFPALTKPPSTSELIDWARCLTRPESREQNLLDLRQFIEDIGSGASSDRLKWSRLPLISCLIKLREDAVRLGVTG